MIFVDTWAWIGLAVKQDQYHAAVKAEHQSLRQAGRNSGRLGISFEAVSSPGRLRLPESASGASDCGSQRWRMRKGWAERQEAIERLQEDSRMKGKDVEHERQ